ncbi:hypothetical protein F5Y07DRAFT_112308 [Xylaria sp. FL0933]|nr:hypothetical protein F5Y07DRAFT_112308 [Xylaria sp. FL0933]
MCLSTDPELAYRGEQVHFFFLIVWQPPPLPLYPVGCTFPKRSFHCQLGQWRRMSTRHPPIPVLLGIPPQPVPTRPNLTISPNKILRIPAPVTTRLISLLHSSQGKESKIEKSGLKRNIRRNSSIIVSGYLSQAGFPGPTSRPGLTLVSSRHAPWSVTYKTLQLCYSAFLFFQSPSTRFSASLRVSRHAAFDSNFRMAHCLQMRVFRPSFP